MIPLGILASAVVSQGILHAEYLTILNGNTSQAQYNFTGVNFGVESETRDIVVAVMSYEASVTNIINVTVGGVIATLVAGVNTAHESQLMYAHVPTGATGTITVDYQDVLPPDRCYVMVWAVYGGINVATGATDVAQPPHTSITGYTNGVVISAFFHSSTESSSTVWGFPMIEDVDFRDNSFNWNVSGAHTETAGVFDVNATDSGTGFRFIIVGAFGP